MKLVELLIETAVADSELLASNQQLKDRLELQRDIDFLLWAKDQATAQLVADFVTDYRYGQPFVEGQESDRGEYSWQLRITIHTPATEHVVMSLSAFMACLSRLFDLDYDGWSCDLKT